MGSMCTVQPPANLQGSMEVGGSTVPHRPCKHACMQPLQCRVVRPTVCALNPKSILMQTQRMHGGEMSPARLEGAQRHLAAAAAAAAVAEAAPGHPPASCSKALACKASMRAAMPRGAVLAGASQGVPAALCSRLSRRAKRDQRANWESRAVGAGGGVPSVGVLLCARRSPLPSRRNGYCAADLRYKGHMR